MKLSTLHLVLFMMLASSAVFVFGQGRPYEGPDDPAGDIAAVREGYMTGNRVFLYFQNTTELSDWPEVDVSRWPNDYTGTKMTDGINILICAEVFLENDTIPVTDPNIIASRNDLDTLWYCQTAFRGGLDLNPEGTLQWGFYPVFGYFRNDETNEYPAMSNLPNSWPPDGWPSTGGQLKWPGVWNGRFGLGVMYADLETYFVANDAQDQEYLEDTDTLKYYPRPGKFIGDKKPDVTIQKGAPWGGIGVRVETRGYQWANPLVRDAIFFEYNVANISDYDLPSVGFGFHVDNGIGNENNDELGYYDTYLDLAFSWDIDETGQYGVRTGLMGIAFLESPGIAFDGVDNDEDGIVDEQRDNKATALIGATDGYEDLDKFLTFYRLNEADLKEHWDADEDQDWMDGDDLDQDGSYSDLENPGDDVGLDGIGAAELNYPGPDEGECNHKPDFVEGVGCEPNFAVTDISESDMLGLTAFTLFHVQEEYHGRPRTFHQDWVMYQLVATGMFTLSIEQISNLIEVFGSGPFSLFKGRTERISMAMLHSFDDLGQLQQDPPVAPIMFELKRVVQMIYEKDYRFAQPPKMPTLTATAGDGEVVLTWDDMADTRSREPFLGGANDFEGYKLIRATDKKFQDAMVVTDGYGTPALYKPIFQCDKIDHKTGFTDFGLLNGMGYYLGEDTGIQHYYVDKNVQNGITYYYGIIAYDYGISDSIAPPGIAPSENNLVIELDEAEEVRQYGKNVAIVTPHQMAPGYTAQSIEIIANSVKESAGMAVPQIISRNALKPNHVYTFKFLADTISSVSKSPTSINYLTVGYTIWDVTDSNRVVQYENLEKYQTENLVYQNIALVEGETDKRWHTRVGKDLTSDVADGFVVNYCANVISSEHGGYDFVNSGWAIGNAGITVTPTNSTIRSYPWDYELIFTSDPEAFTAKTSYAPTMRDENSTKLERDVTLTQQSLNFFMLNKTFAHTDGSYDTLEVVVVDSNQTGAVELTEDRFIFGVPDTNGKWYQTLFAVEFSQVPQANDVYFVTCLRPPFVTDSVTFKILPEGKINTSAIESQMDKIKVVPNPYVATNSMEPVVANYLLNQRRRILFTHLPAQCDIKIFTMSGVLIKEIAVDNASDNGIAHWDVLTSEGLEVAAGMYLYHVKARKTNAEKIGKFAIIK